MPEKAGAHEKDQGEAHGGALYRPNVSRRSGTVNRTLVRGACLNRDGKQKRPRIAAGAPP